MSDTRATLVIDDSRVSHMMVKGIAQQKYSDTTVFEVGNAEETLTLDISDEFKGRIFQAFSQADTSNTKNTSGTGLGLVISKNIIGHHQGSINFDSTAPNGTCFYFTLPIT